MELLADNEHLPLEDRLAQIVLGLVVSVNRHSEARGGLVAPLRVSASLNRCTVPRSCGGKLIAAEGAVGRETAKIADAPNKSSRSAPCNLAMLG
jgi:hypothetical protein